MGLLGLLKKLKTLEKEFKILILGVGSSGKTSLLNALYNQNAETQPTNQFNIIHKDDSGLKLTYYDISGSSQSIGYWRNYYDMTDIVIFVVDSTDQSQFVDAKKELDSIRNNERLVSSSILVVNSKIDLPNSTPAENLAVFLELTNSDKRHRCDILPFSIQNTSMIFSIHQWILNEIQSRLSP